MFAYSYSGEIPLKAKVRADGVGLHPYILCQVVWRSKITKKRKSNNEIFQIKLES